MNVYHVSRCPSCHKPIVLDGNIMVHGTGNVNRAFDLIGRGMHPKIVAKHFCGNCGEYCPTIGTCACMLGYREQHYESV